MLDSITIKEEVFAEFAIKKLAEKEKRKQEKQEHSIKQNWQTMQNLENVGEAKQQSKVMKRKETYFSGVGDE